MAHSMESSDVGLMNLLRRDGSLGIGDIVSAMGVTATAVRQRLTRLMAAGLVERGGDDGRTGRGRPGHRYWLTEAGLRKMGANFDDLALAMWKEIRAVKDPEVRRGLLERLAATMAEMYGEDVSGATTGERMQSVRKLFAERNVPFSVDESRQLPVLVAEACPYPGLPEQDRSICAMERLLFSKLLQSDVRLSGCRLDGLNCCTFEMA